MEFPFGNPGRLPRTRVRRKLAGMDSRATVRRWTIEDLERLPDDGQKHELQAGLLLSEPLPGMRHGRVAAEIAARLRSFVRRRRLGVVFGNDTGFVLSRSPDTARGPDIAFVTGARFRAVGDRTGPFPGAPDLAVEVLSPSNTPAGVHAKVADYLAAGARLVWVVDTEAETVAVHRSLLSPRVLSREETLDGEDVLPGFRVKVARVFEV